MISWTWFGQDWMERRFEMGFPKITYRALEDVVGPEFVSNDPAICIAYSRGGYGMGVYDRAKKLPGCVILPKDTEEIQAIVRIANRYKIPYIPVSTYFISFCTPFDQTPS